MTEAQIEAWVFEKELSAKVSEVRFRLLDTAGKLRCLLSLLLLRRPQLQSARAEVTGLLQFACTDPDDFVRVVAAMVRPQIESSLEGNHNHPSASSSMLAPLLQEATRDSHFKHTVDACLSAATLSLSIKSEDPSSSISPLPISLLPRERAYLMQEDGSKFNPISAFKLSAKATADSAAPSKALDDLQQAYQGAMSAGSSLSVHIPPSSSFPGSSAQPQTPSYSAPKYNTPRAPLPSHLQPSPSPSMSTPSAPGSARYSLPRSSLPSTAPSSSGGGLLSSFAPTRAVRRPHTTVSVLDDAESSALISKQESERKRKLENIGAETEEEKAQRKKKKEEEREARKKGKSDEIAKIKAEKRAKKAKAREEKEEAKKQKREERERKKQEKITYIEQRKATREERQRQRAEEKGAKKRGRKHDDNGSGGGGLVDMDEDAHSDASDYDEYVTSSSESDVSSDSEESSSSSDSEIGSDVEEEEKQAKQAKLRSREERRRDRDEKRIIKAQKRKQLQDKREARERRRIARDANNARFGPVLPRMQGSGRPPLPEKQPAIKALASLAVNTAPSPASVSSVYAITASSAPPSTPAVYPQLQQQQSQQPVRPVLSYFGLPSATGISAPAPASVVGKTPSDLLQQVGAGGATLFGRPLPAVPSISSMPSAVPAVPSASSTSNLLASALGNRPILPSSAAPTATSSLLGNAGAPKPLLGVPMATPAGLSAPSSTASLLSSMLGPNPAAMAAAMAAQNAASALAQQAAQVSAATRLRADTILQGCNRASPLVYNTICLFLAGQRPPATSPQQIELLVHVDTVPDAKGEMWQQMLNINYSTGEWQKLRRKI